MFSRQDLYQAQEAVWWRVLGLAVIKLWAVLVQFTQGYSAYRFPGMPLKNLSVTLFEETNNLQQTTYHIT